jgi:hypothetical protein
MKKILITFSIVLIYISSITAQEVKNVSSEITGNIIQIDYDLSSAKYNQIFNISM